jgi:hypothetical protein
MIFGPEAGDITGGKLHNKGLHNVLFLLDINFGWISEGGLGRLGM